MKTAIVLTLLGAVIGTALCLWLIANGFGWVADALANGAGWQ
jgi:Na+/phosphate symporter